MISPSNYFLFSRFVDLLHSGEPSQTQIEGEREGGREREREDRERGRDGVREGG